MSTPAIPDRMPARYNPTVETWDDLNAQADEVMGNELASDELLDALVGVPFLIHHLSFRPGALRKDKTRGAYISSETVLAPVFNLTKINNARKASGLERLSSLDDLPFRQGDHVVFNDGSTGIYRQEVEYLTAKGYIVPNGGELVTGGPMGESSYDRIPSDWAKIHHGDLRFTPDGFGVYEIDIRLKCPRGIRISDYDNEWTAPGERARTRYLA